MQGKVVKAARVNDLWPFYWALRTCDCSSIRFFQTMWWIESKLNLDPSFPASVPFSGVGPLGSYTSWWKPDAAPNSNHLQLRLCSEFVEIKCCHCSEHMWASEADVGGPRGISEPPPPPPLKQLRSSFHATAWTSRMWHTRWVRWGTSAPIHKESASTDEPRWLLNDLSQSD